MSKPANAPNATDAVELNWYKNHYRGQMRQLTLRAVLMGSALGAVLSLTNLYIGLKTGWGFGVAITACVLSYAIWKFLQKMRMSSIITLLLLIFSFAIGLKTGWWLGISITFVVLTAITWVLFRKKRIVNSEMTVLENNAMQSTASAAGYSTGGTLVSAIAAFLLVNGVHIPYGMLTLWIFFLAVLGVTLAIPMKRQMINVERLRFPSGIAAAMTLRSLHNDTAHNPALEKPLADMTDEETQETIDHAFNGEAKADTTAELDDVDLEGMIEGEEQADKSAKALFFAGGIGAIIAFLRDGFVMLAEVGLLKKPFHIIHEVYPLFGKKALDYTVGAEGSLLLVAGGALMGIRVATSVLIGAILNWCILVPYMHNIGVIEALNYRTMVSWSLWGGAACMVTSGLLAFALQWKSVVRALSGLGDIFGKKKTEADDELGKFIEKVEVPSSWFATGALVGGIGVVWIAHSAFGMPYWMSILAIVLSFFLALVACRVAGETDTTPVGAMGKVTQLMYGAIAPGKTNVNLMAACITAGVADSASDLLIDLKSGYVLGANPRKQFLAQFSGIFIGTAVTVPTFYLLVPSADALGTDQWPAPAAQVWASVARLLSNGLDSLHPTAQIALVVGGLLGILLVLLPKWLPVKARAWVPSPLGIGLAFTFHFWYAFSMFVGGLIAYIVQKKYPKTDATYTVPAASGLIAGESLMGIFLILLPILVGLIAGKM